jgi:hypothetical protein
VKSFCCEQMRVAIEDPTVPIEYTAKMNEIGVLVLDGPIENPSQDGLSQINFTYCPWCGQCLPQSLRDTWFEEMEKRGIDPWVDDVPDEFKDDAWYQALTAVGARQSRSVNLSLQAGFHELDDRANHRARGVAVVHDVEGMRIAAQRHGREGIERRVQSRKLILAGTGEE